MKPFNNLHKEAQTNFRNKLIIHSKDGLLTCSIIRVHHFEPEHSIHGLFTHVHYIKTEHITEDLVQRNLETMGKDEGVLRDDQVQ